MLVLSSLRPLPPKAHSVFSGWERPDLSVDSLDPTGHGGVPPDQYQPRVTTRVLRRSQKGIS